MLSERGNTADDDVGSSRQATNLSTLCGAIERVDERLARCVTPRSIDVFVDASEAQRLAGRREDRRILWEQLRNSSTCGRDIVQNFDCEAFGGQGSGSSPDPLGARSEEHT